MKDNFNNAVGPQVQARAKKRKTGRIIPVLAVLSLVAGLQTASQFLAQDFRYQPALGGSMHGIYPPWSILRWAGRWYHEYPDAFMRAGSVSTVTAGLGLLVLAVVKMLLANSSRANEYLHGSARWANIEDIRRAGLLPRRPAFWRTGRRGRETGTSSGGMSAPARKRGMMALAAALAEDFLLCAEVEDESGRGQGPLPSW